MQVQKKIFNVPLGIIRSSSKLNPSQILHFHPFEWFYISTEQNWDCNCAFISVHRLRQPAVLCVPETGENSSSCVRNTEKEQAQIHQRFFHQSQISNGNFSFKQRFCRKCCFLTEKVSHQNEVDVNSETLQSCLGELWLICFFPCSPSPTLSRTFGKHNLFPRLWSEQGSSEPDPEQALQAVQTEDGHKTQTFLYKNTTKIQIRGIKYLISAFGWKFRACKGRGFHFPPAARWKSHLQPLIAREFSLLSLLCSQLTAPPI